MDHKKKKFEIFSQLNFNKNEIAFFMSGDSINNGQPNEHDEIIASNISKALQNVF